MSNSDDKDESGHTKHKKESKKGEFLRYSEKMVLIKVLTTTSPGAPKDAIERVK